MAIKTIKKPVPAAASLPSSFTSMKHLWYTSEQYKSPFRPEMPERSAKLSLNKSVTPNFTRSPFIGTEVSILNFGIWTITFFSPIISSILSSNLLFCESFASSSDRPSILLGRIINMLNFLPYYNPPMPLLFV